MAARCRDRRHPHATHSNRRRGTSQPKRSANGFPDVGVLVLSHYLDLRFALRLLEEPSRARRLPAQGAGIGSWRCSPTRCSGSTRTSACFDPTIVMRLMQHRREPDTLAPLTARELEVLGADRGGTLEHRDRTATRRDRQDGRGPYPKHLRKARAGRGDRFEPARPGGLEVPARRPERIAIYMFPGRLPVPLRMPDSTAGGF